MILSVIFPAYREPLLQKTIDSFLDASELGNEVELLPVIDGKWLKTPLKEDPRVRPVQLQKNIGMRAAINAGISEAKGRWIMKADAHCLFAKGFDRIMVENGKEDWLLVPRRYSLDEEGWQRDDTRPVRDYHYLQFPTENKYGIGLVVLDWYKSSDKDIDETMIFQGSCWLADKEYFMSHVGLLDDSPETYGSFVGEQHEIGLKYWLGGGAIMVNKKTWYAHLAKRPKHYLEKGYARNFKTADRTAKQHTWCANHWVNDEEPNMIHKFEWLVNKFQPPTWKLPYVK